MYNPRHLHSADQIAGYHVVRTLTREGAARREIVDTIPGADGRARALQVKNARMSARQGGEWFVVDPLYACGCVREPYDTPGPAVPAPREPGGRLAPSGSAGR